MCAAERHRDEETREQESSGHGRSPRRPFGSR
jgi:hypothetical protein